MTKTGTTALEAALAPRADLVFQGDPRNKHMPLRKFDRFVRPYLRTLGHEDIETACLFRDPLDWLHSWYRYRSRDAIAGQKNSTQGISFDAFISAYLQDPKPPFARVGFPSEFVRNSVGPQGVTHLFAYEAFSDFLDFLQSRLGHDFTLDRKNVSPVVPLDVSDENRAALRRYLSDSYVIHDALARIRQ